MVVIREQVTDYTDLLKCRIFRELGSAKIGGYIILFLYYTNCINLSIRFVYPSVWRKKIRSSKENLNFNVRASGRKSKHTCFSKASAKVQLFFDMTKYFCKKMHIKMHFLCNSLKINDFKNAYFLTYLSLFGRNYVV